MNEGSGVRERGRKSVLAVEERNRGRKGGEELVGNRKIKIEV